VAVSCWHQCVGGRAVLRSPKTSSFCVSHIIRSGRPLLCRVQNLGAHPVVSFPQTCVPSLSWQLNLLHKDIETGKKKAFSYVSSFTPEFVQSGKHRQCPQLRPAAEEREDRERRGRAESETLPELAWKRLRHAQRRDGRLHEVGEACGEVGPPHRDGGEPTANHGTARKHPLF
jgi:hypothetical protein